MRERKSCAVGDVLPGSGLMKLIRGLGRVVRSFRRSKPKGIFARAVYGSVVAREMVNIDCESWLVAFRDMIHHPCRETR
jgi:hypothetical protein